MTDSYNLSLDPVLSRPQDPPSPLPLLPTTTPTARIPINLLLQHNTINARLQRREHQARLALQHPQPI